MLPLKQIRASDKRFPGFEIPRAAVDIHFEPVGPETRIEVTYFDSALIDTGTGFLVIPHRVHKSNLLKVHREIGQMPYRVPSMTTGPVLQRFAEIGLRFLTKDSNGSFTYWPEHFVSARAFLLDADLRPQTKVLVGLDVLLEHFVTHLERNNSFLRAPG